MVFHHTSEACYRWLQKQPNVKEESLTDWILYTISERTDRFYYKAFTRNEEAANGADWEWWVLADDCQGLCAYRFLVQAKKLKRTQDNYPLIAYGNRNGLQIDLLIDSAKHRNAMPIYIYYSVAAPELAQQINNFHFFDTDIVAWCRDCINGAYMSMAQSVKQRVFDSPRKKITEVDLLNNSLGLSVCDFLFHSKHSSKKIMDLLNRCYINNIENDTPVSSNGMKHFGNSIPNYLNTLIDQKRNFKSFPDWYESEFEHQLNGIAGVAVVDLRKR